MKKIFLYLYPIQEYNRSFEFSEEYLYEIEHNKNYQVINAGGDAWISNHIDIENYMDANQVIAHIEDYFKDHNGSCDVNYSK